MRDQVTSQKLGSAPLSWMMIPTSFKWLLSMASSLLEMTYSTYNRMLPIAFSMYHIWYQKKSYQIPQFKSKKLRFLWHFWGISRWLLQRYIHWGKWRRAPLAGCVHVLPHGVGYGRLEGGNPGRWRAPSNKCTVTYHDEEKNMFWRHPHFSTSTKKHWSWRSEAFDEMIVFDVRHSQNWHVKTFKRLVNWFSPATR